MRRALIALALLWFGFANAGYGCAPHQEDARDDSSHQAPEPERSASAVKPPFRPSIPQAWDEGTVVNLQLPLADAKHSPVEIPWEYYYRIPRRLIYKSYAVYAPGHEPPGYFKWLKQ